MKSFLTILAVLALCTQVHSQNTYLQLKDEGGKLIAGNAFDRGFEKQIEAVKLVQGAKDGLVRFVMDQQSASNILQAMLRDGRRLQGGLVTTTIAIGEGRPSIHYTIRMEDAAVVSCENNADNTTTVVLQPARSGTTYYQTDRKTGSSRVASKTGYDWTTGKTWNNFN